MQTSSSFLLFQPPLTHVGGPFSGDPLQSRRTTLAAFKKDDNYGRSRRGGKMVDENMIVLRERIRKMKEIEECCDADDSDINWMMQWEKTYISNGGYHSDVYEAVAVLQLFLMETRPSVALGLLALLAVGGSTAAVTVVQMLVNLVHGN